MKKTLLSLLIFLPLTTYAQEKSLWDYPIKPKTEEWKKLKGNKAKVDACQIPEDVLRDISTDDLMSLCLRYPPLYNVYAFNNRNTGLKFLFEHFNGIREFAKRERAVDKLREQYISDISDFPGKISTVSDLELGYAILHISMLECLLSYAEFYANTSTETQKKVLETLLWGYQKCKDPEYFDKIGFRENLFARANLIIRIDTAWAEKFKTELRPVLAAGMADADLIDTIDRLSYELIK